MNQVDQNINKDMCNSDIIDVESLDFSDDQTWLYKLPDDSGEKLDVMDWCLSIDWPFYDDEGYQETENQLNAMLDDILKNQVLAMPDKHKFDSRTYVKPKRRVLRASIQNIAESPPSIHQTPSKYLTYNKHNAPLGPILRLKTFNVDTNTDNSKVVKDFALKRRSLVQEDEVQLDDIDLTLMSEGSDRLSSEHVPSKPINIDLSQPAHNIHNTFNKGYTNMLNDRGSLNMYQSGESLMRMSPPSLVTSLLMESSGNFNAESLEGKKSFITQRDSGLQLLASQTGRESFDPMVTSMTLSILDEKDMNTSFLSQTTHNDNDSLIGIGSSPPSLVSSINSSYIVGNSSKNRESADSNIFSSATFTRLEQSERLLTARPRCQMFNSYTKKEPGIWNSESYTKAREEACQIDTTNILNEIAEKKESSSNNDMSETITLHYANNKYKHDQDAEKENMDATFEKDDAFYKDMGLQKTMDKQELNEIIQARQKLSLARKTLPTDVLPNQVETTRNSIINARSRSIENASELLARRRATNGSEKESREVKRNSTFKLSPPKPNLMNATIVFNNSDDKKVIDINSATMNLIDPAETTLQQEEWCSQERAMVGSSESTDTGTFSSSSPPESVPETSAPDPRLQVASTPLTVRKTAKMDLLNLHATISPIYDTDDKSYSKSPSNYGTYDSRNTTVINSGTIVKKSTARRDIMNVRTSPEKKPAVTGYQQKSPPLRVPSAESYNNPHLGALRKTGLPSKLRQYSSHKELRLPISSGSTTLVRAHTGGAGLPRAPAAPDAPAAPSLLRRGVYASNPALSPTARRDSYTIAARPTEDKELDDEKPAVKPMTAPPALVRQGTETLKRERPQSQLVQPKDLRPGPGSGVPVMRSHHMPPPNQRPYSIAGTAQLRVSRPTSVPSTKAYIGPAPVVDPRPASGCEPRASALPRPSRLPAPRRGLRPPSVYSVTSAADGEHY